MSVGRTAKSRIAAILCSESFRQIPLELGKDVCQSVAASGTRFAVSVAGIVLCIRTAIRSRDVGKYIPRGSQRGLVGFRTDFSNFGTGWLLTKNG